MFTKLVKFVVVDSITYVSFDVTYHNGVNSTICIPVSCSCFTFTFYLSTINISVYQQ